MAFAESSESYPSSIPINLNNLLNLQGVESQRVEFKKAWHNDRKIKGGPYWQVLHTVTAFANDYYNVNGGYIIIGVEEKELWESPDNRQIIFPPCGVQGDLAKIQNEIAGACRGNIKPLYVPILQPEVVHSPGAETKSVLVIWVRPSDERPHMCKESDKGELKYYIREATETKIAQEREITHLCRYKSIPFDDRPAMDNDTGRPVSESDIDKTRVRKFLKGTGSQLARQTAEPITLYRKLDLVQRIADKVVDGELLPVFAPINVALLFFNPSPHHFFKGAWTEIAVFSHNNDPKEPPKEVTGPIDQQIETCLSFILEKPKEVACHAFVAYPKRALREAVVNAFHHRSYEASDPDPVKIHIKPSYIDIMSYPGPDPSLKPEDFLESKEVPPVPSRNRRIAGFLKSLKLAEALYTGVGTIFRSMKENQNPTPQFDFSTSYFRVRLPGHPKYIVQSIRSRVDNLCAKGDEALAVELIKKFLDENQSMWSETLVLKLIELLATVDDKHDPNVCPYHKFIEDRKQRRIPLKEELSKWCESEIQDISSGVKLVEKLVEEGATLADVSCVRTKASDLCQQKDDRGRPQLKALQNAHKLYDAMSEVVLTDAKLSLQYASCYFNLYVLNTQKDQKDPELKQRKAGTSTRERIDLLPILIKAEDYVNTAIDLTKEDDKQLRAHEYRLLGYIHSKRCSIQRSTEKQVTDCYDKAKFYDPNIKINTVYVPAGYRAQYTSSSERPVGSEYHTE